MPLMPDAAHYSGIPEHDVTLALPRRTHNNAPTTTHPQQRTHNNAPTTTHPRTYVYRTTTLTQVPPQLRRKTGMTSHPHFLWADLFKKNKNPEKPIIQALRGNILFNSLTPRELRYLSEHVYERIYQPEEAIFQQNDRGLGLYLITHGQVAIKSQTTGGEFHITTLSEGSFFGEIALIDPDHMRTASAISLTRSEVIGFFKPDLAEILESNPTLGVKIMFQLSLVISRRLIETTEKITQLSRELQGARNQ